MKAQAIFRVSDKVLLRRHLNARDAKLFSPPPQIGRIYTISELGVDQDGSQLLKLDGIKSDCFICWELFYKVVDPFTLNLPKITSRGPATAPVLETYVVPVNELGHEYYE